MTKKILGRYGNDRQHWVGDGFPVRSLFSYNTLGAHISPFLLLDYAGPHVFDSSEVSPVAARGWLFPENQGEGPAQGRGSLAAGRKRAS